MTTDDAAGRPARARIPNLAWIAFGGAVVVQLFVLYVPAVPGGDPPAYADKVVHLAVFAAGAWTGHRAGIGTYALGVALVAHAVASELLQMTLLPGRSGDPLDVLADVAGVVVGLVVARHWPRATMDP